jgi:GABA(A) receptor-associated protein
MQVIMRPLSEEDTEKLLKESRSIKSRYPEKIPVIVNTKNKKLKMDRQKFLIPNDLTVSQFIYVIRKRIELKKESAIFMLVNDMMPASSQTMEQLYNEQMDTNTEMLFVDIAMENTFG